MHIKVQCSIKKHHVIRSYLRLLLSEVVLQVPHLHLVQNHCSVHQTLLDLLADDHSLVPFLVVVLVRRQMCLVCDFVLSLSYYAFDEAV